MKFFGHINPPYYTSDPRYFNVDFIPPYTCLLFLGVSAVSLISVIHIGATGVSKFPFLAPLDCQEVELTSTGIEGPDDTNEMVEKAEEAAHPVAGAAVGLAALAAGSLITSYLV